MKRSKGLSVELTPLLDVVFILLFALMLNVNVSKAKDEEQIDTLKESVTLLEESQSSLQSKYEETAESRAQYKLQLESEQSEKADLLALTEDQAHQLEENRKKLEAVETSLSETIGEKEVLEQWLQYEQISERYLFVEVRITNLNGRVYIDDAYTGVNISWEDALDRDVKKEKMDDLASFFYNWLDHKEDGYSFVFVTVAAESHVTRAATEIVFDTLGMMQPNFDRDKYLINKYIRYQ